LKVTVDGEEKNIHTLWREGSNVKLIDQRILPHKFEILTLKNHRDTAEAIKIMILRGAGAIGVAAGYGMAQAALEAKDLTLNEFEEYLNESADRLRNTRPTAANLFHAIDRCLAAGSTGTVSERVEAIVAEADSIAEEDLEASQR
jgi:methylthioribose-1-phosphate isomerase